MHKLSLLQQAVKALPYRLKRAENNLLVFALLDTPSFLQLERLN